MYNQVMAIQPRTRKPSGPDKRRARWRVPISAIQKLVREIAEKFHPDKIILFGSYAYGKPHRDSDVDLLVVMPAWNEISKASRIACAVDRSFPLDILVRTPENLRWRMEEGDWFLREAVGKGLVLYEKANRPMGSQGRSRPRSRQKHRQD
jgi:predicted nucleotidyltransferase